MYAVNKNIGWDLLQGDNPCETLALIQPPSIPAMPLINISAYCRLILKVWQRDSEIKLRVALWSMSARTWTWPSAVWRSTHAVVKNPQAARGTFACTVWTCATMALSATEEVLATDYVFEYRTLDSLLSYWFCLPQDIIASDAYADNVHIAIYLNTSAWSDPTVDNWSRFAFL